MGKTYIIAEIGINHNGDIKLAKELISQARENLSAWHLIVTPLSAMAITLFLITFIGEAVREAFDPKTYSRLR